MKNGSAAALTSLVSPSPHFTRDLHMNYYLEYVLKKKDIRPVFRRPAPLKISES